MNFACGSLTNSEANLVLPLAGSSVENVHKSQLFTNDIIATNNNSICDL